MQSAVPILVLLFPILGVGILWMTHLAYSRLPPATHMEPFELLLKIVGWCLILVGLFAPLAVTIIGIAVIVVGIVIILMAVVQYRTQERRALLWMLAVSAERGLPLSTAARAFAADRADSVGRGAMRLAELLDSGIPLPDALYHSRNRLPTDAEVTTRLEYAAGGLGTAMIDAARDAAERERLWRPMFEKALYFLLLTVVAAVVMSFMMLRTVPAFEQLFWDFDTELPSLTMLVINISNWVVDWGWLLKPPCLVMLAALMLGPTYSIGWLRWEPWPVHWFTRPFHRATVLLSLARATEAGRPLTDTFVMLAHWYPQSAIRQNLQFVAARADHGEDWCEAMQRVRLLSASGAGVLKAAQRVGNLPWAMREMATRNHRRMESAVGVLNNVLLPLLLLAYALPVAMIVIALFIPLVSLIQNLA